jgi:hypothetical protein
MTVTIGRWELLAALGGAAAWPVAVPGQQLDRVRRISVVNIIAATDPEAEPRIAAFELGLRELG